MIYSQRNSVVRLLPHSSDYPEAVLPIQGLNRIKAVDFDPVAHYLYWVCNNTILLQFYLYLINIPCALLKVCHRHLTWE